MVKKNFYAVLVGRNSGIFTSWEECSAQVTGYSGALFKGFSTVAEAESYLGIVPFKLPQVQASLSDVVVVSPQVETYCKIRVNVDPLKSAMERGDQIIYTDGSAHLGQSAGIGVYFGDDDMRNVSAPLDRPPYTNQRAELAALLQALCIVLADPSLTNVTIATDSAYAKGCDEWQKNGWRNSRNKPVKNQDLIEDTWTILKKAQKKATIHFVKVKGHSNIKGNEAADRLAAQANKK